MTEDHTPRPDRQSLLLDLQAFNYNLEVLTDYLDLKLPTVHREPALDLLILAHRLLFEDEYHLEHDKPPADEGEDWDHHLELLYAIQDFVTERIHATRAGRRQWRSAWRQAWRVGRQRYREQYGRAAMKGKFPTLTDARRRLEQLKPVLQSASPEQQNEAKEELYALQRVYRPLRPDDWPKVLLDDPEVSWG
jgi:hypothetical protein